MKKVFLSIHCYDGTGFVNGIQDEEYKTIEEAKTRVEEIPLEKGDEIVITDEEGNQLFSEIKE